MTKQKVAIGIDLGGTKIKGVLVDERGHVVHKLTHATLDQKDNSDNSGKFWKKAVYDMVRNLKGKARQNLEAIGAALFSLKQST